jgi:hypothetical protein
VLGCKTRYVKLKKGLVLDCCQELAALFEWKILQGTTDRKACGQGLRSKAL